MYPYMLLNLKYNTFNEFSGACLYHFKLLNPTKKHCLPLPLTDITCFHVIKMCNKSFYFINKIYFLLFIYLLIKSHEYSIIE